MSQYTRTPMTTYIESKTNSTEKNASHVGSLKNNRDCTVN